MERTYPTSHLLKKNQSLIWRPYTQSKTAVSPILISKAEGAYLYDDENKPYLDAISSWWVTTHGHNHPYITDRIMQQLKSLDQVIFADFTHHGAIELAERLLHLLDIKQGRVFYSDNGSTAVETALKMALQYWFQKSTLRQKVICFDNAYHGDTFGAMSASGQNAFNLPFWPYLFQVETIPVPLAGQEEISINALNKLLKNNDVACFIFEPLLQGAAGMHIHSLSGLETLIRLCQNAGVITIADEVMTGFGRLGPIFVRDLMHIKPEITCLSKGITGGFLPFGATICNELIYQEFYSDEPSKAFLHGHSYCGSPIACAAALANLDLFAEDKCNQQRQFIHCSHATFVNKWKTHPRLKRCEAIGTILIIEYLPENSCHSTYFSPFKERLKKYFLGSQIYIRPLGNVLYLMPPFCICIEDLQKIYTCIENTLEGDICI